MEPSRAGARRTVGTVSVLLAALLHRLPQTRETLRRWRFG
jgi:hypothetical protein